MKLSLGASQFYWPQEHVDEFYDRAANSRVDIIYLGETVCSKRAELKTAQWLELARELRKRGKQVVLSTMVLIESAGELSAMKKLCDNGEFLVEVNDLGALQVMSELKLPFVVGPAINCYNIATLKLFLSKGMIRWTMPVELSKDWLGEILGQAQEQNIRHKFECEVFSWGYLPLAYSARCFTARSEDRPKDDCQLACIKYPQGRKALSREGEPLFVLNGIQTMSADQYNLINELKHMEAMGVDVARISADSEDAISQVERFTHQLLEPKRERLAPDQCNGYWHRIAGMETSENN